MSAGRWLAASAESLRVLMLEDAATDAELCESELRASGLDSTVLRVETRGAFEAALTEFAPDLIISDFSLPGAFDGLRALDIVRSRDSDTPFVFVSGTIGEERAVEAMRRGATDYVLKDRLARLTPVITRALKERAERVALREAHVELDEMRRHMERILGSLRDVVWSMGGTPRRLLYLNPAAEKLYARPVAALLDDPELLPSLICSADRERVAALLQRAFEGHAFEAEYRIDTPDGARWVQDRGDPVYDSAGHVVRVDGVTRDVTQHRLDMDRIVRLSRMRTVSSRINSAIVRIKEARPLHEVVCRIAVEDGGFLCAWIGRIDPRTQRLEASALSGVCVEHLLASAIEAVNAGEAFGEGLIGAALRTRQVAVADDAALDVPVFGCSGSAANVKSVAVLPLFVGDDPAAVLCLYTGDAAVLDAEEVKLLREIGANVSFALAAIDKASRLDYLAYYDVLTGLANRRLLDDRIRQLLTRAAADQSSVMVLAIDLERFRSINETLGIQAGDAILKCIGERLTRASEGRGTAGRLAADAFVLALPTPRQDADLSADLVEEISVVLCEPIDVAGERLAVQPRFGVAIYPSDGSEASALIANAEAALKQAKGSRDKFLFYAREMNARVAVLLKLENQLRKALHSQEFVLHYQPRVLLETQQIVAVEALLRWQSPEMGLVSPAEFIPLLEETGLILDVGRWIMHQAVADARGWRARGCRPVSIGVNVSAIQLRQKDFVDQIATAFGRDGECGQPFEIELTESMIMSNVDDNAAKLRAIRAAGVKIAVDDFGTGYSSLSYLVKLPLDTLKIDRSFVSDMAGSAEHMAIVRTVLLLAEALRLGVVAEGIETREQAAMLARLRCGQGQGYIYSRPVPADALERMLRPLPRSSAPLRPERAPPREPSALS